MKGYAGVVQMQINDHVYADGVGGELPPPEDLMKIDWTIVIPVGNEKRELVCFTKEEDMADWLRKSKYSELYLSFRNAMEIRKTLREILNIRLLYDHQFMRWFGEVQTLCVDCNHPKHIPACHWIFSDPQPPLTRNDTNSKHINDRAAIPNLYQLPRNNNPPNWGRQIKSLEICTGGKGAMLYMGLGFEPPAAIFPGSKSAPVVHTELVVNGNDYKLSQSLKDLGQF